ncbi:hypothetical protein NUW58_g5729 [Xylaria curta]|uniref:Uncharacterized protein n=1 Tax=Xylaria curta TaxID=42375 RepID=A0ACC1P1E1_9PEZI|nr:hypothetical protein NUW58_g5729 [Xylaria curta]
MNKDSANLSSQSNSPRPPLPESNPSAIPEQESRSLIQGESSLSAQSSFANNFLTNSIGKNQESGLGTEMNEELTKLRQIVDAFRRTPLSQEWTPTPPPRRDDYKLPPIETVVAFIRSTQGHFWYDGFNQLLSCENLSDLCLKIYFSNQYTDSEFIILNASLILFSFDSNLDDTDEVPSKERNNNNRSFLFLCRRNLETAISRLPLLPPATHDTVLALFLSAVYAIDISKPSLAWRLINTASQISYMLGFHTRAEGADKSTNVLNKHGRLFWILYLLDKHLSLQLGYSSPIQDRDITVPSPASSHTPATGSMQYWQNLVNLANIAGRIYEDLYSPLSLALPANERGSRAMKLAHEMQQNMVEAERELWFQSIRGEYPQHLARFSFLSDDVFRQSMATLIHRAVPVHLDSETAFTEECIHSARVALQAHEACVATIIDNPRYLVMYFQWTVLFSPFIPFIVLFCHIVATGNTSDLARIQSFVASIREAGEKSPAVVKLHRLFDVFCSVAQRFSGVGSAINTPQREEQMQINSYLVELGLQTGGNRTSSRLEDGSDGREGLLRDGQSDISSADQAKDNGTMDWTNQGLPLGNWVPLNQNMSE